MKSFRTLITFLLKKISSTHSGKQEKNKMKNGKSREKISIPLYKYVACTDS